MPPKATRRAVPLERSLETLVSMLEEMAPEIDREKQDATDAKDFLEMLENTYARGRRQAQAGPFELERARRDMARAGQQRQSAEKQAEAARLRRVSGADEQLTVALNAMQEAAARDLASADAAMAKAKLLRPTRPEQEDPNIAAALEAAAGKSPAPKGLSERLAALRTRAER